MTARKIAALKALAERPGTEAEGKVARAMLKRAQAKAPKVSAKTTNVGGVKAFSFSASWDGRDPQSTDEILRQFAQAVAEYCTSK